MVCRLLSLVGERPIKLVGDVGGSINTCCNKVR
jgi:hypothetical protein